MEMDQSTGATPSTGPRRISRFFVVVTLAMVAASLVATIAYSRAGERKDQPRDHLPARKGHVDHAGMMKGPFPDGHSVTRACLGCHPKAGKEMLQSEHFTWLSEEAMVPGKGGKGHESPQKIGKRNLLNNFCLSVESNWPRCTNCHAGYGWKDANFDFTKVENIDCLVCHEQTGDYRKDLGGLPAATVNLVAAAASVARPTRANCGTCHFAGGGGDAVKHGDLDSSLGFPRESLDVHMGKHAMDCVDCHQTHAHKIPGQSLSVSVSGASRVECTDCHAEAPHKDARLDKHLTALACQTCHIPAMAIDAPTKLVWDWSTAGQDGVTRDPHRYLKEKGSFSYGNNVMPEYRWFNGEGERYLKGDPIDPTLVVPINKPLGSIEDPHARIWPFKIHRGKQPYDKENKTLMVAKTYGEGGYWKEFDWDKSLRLGAEASGLPYSGSYGFATTEMYWPLSHMAQPGARALQCQDCHGEPSRMPWRELGYEGDPGRVGDRSRKHVPATGKKRKEISLCPEPR